MILSALVHWRKRFKDNTREIERKTLWLQRFLVCLPPCMDFQKRAMVSFDTDFKSGLTEEETLCAKDIKGFRFGLQSNHWLQNAYMMEHFYGEAPVLSFQRWARTQHPCFDAFLCYLCAKKNNIKVSHEMQCPWRLISSHLTVHMKFDNNFYVFLFSGFFFCLFWLGWVEWWGAVFHKHLKT